MTTRTHTPSLFGDQSGVTLVELVITASIMGLIAGIFVTVLASVQMGLHREQGRSATMDQGRLALESIDRDVRSGNILCSVPASPVNFGLSVYTQSNASTRWLQYRVSSEALQKREYHSSAWTSWRTVASGIQNTSTTPPFVIDTSAAYGSRLVNVTLLVNTATQDATSSDVKLATSIAIRNQSSSVPCSAIPAG
jgi:type II secretory pathway pseudopilin PulG